LSWFSESPSSEQRCFLLSSVRYLFAVNSCLSLLSWSAENAVLGRLSSTTGASPFTFFIFRALGPLDGLSEYLVQKTQAGHSWPFGPRTIPGGQSASAFGASLEVFERSTGTSTSIFGGGFLTGAGLGEGFVLKLGLRIFSMEKLRFFA